MMCWFLRRGLWDFITLVKFALAKPAKIERPPDELALITPKPMSEAIRYVELHKVMACPPEEIPKDERNWLHTTAYKAQVMLYRTPFAPMQPGLPSISDDPHVALKRAFNGLRRKSFHDPELPAEYLGSPDLGSLAVRGPFACYTRRPRTNAPWEWDLRMLNKYEHHQGLVKIGSRVLFREDPVRRALQAYRIECALGNGKIEVTDPEWDQACKIALCAASTHLSLVRHFNWVHLAGGAQLAIATRNSLRTDHSLFRLLWPYIFGTLQSNDMVTRGQMARGGDFETTFSFTYTGMCELFDDTYGQYKHRVNDPEADGNSRHVHGASFDTPTQQNLEKLFEVMHKFVRAYLAIYYPDTKAVRNDAKVLDWLDELNDLLPNGVGVSRRNVTWDTLARMLAGQLYLVTVQHEILGSLMWNYQLWTNRQPARVYQDFRSEPLDVYQRLVNANYILNVHRRALMHNFDYLALDRKAEAAMVQFRTDLAVLQLEMDSHPHAVWQVHPRDLKVNINA
jgi:hypothetical protein